MKSHPLFKPPHPAINLHTLVKSGLSLVCSQIIHQLKRILIRYHYNDTTHFIWDKSPNEYIK